MDCTLFLRQLLLLLWKNFVLQIRRPIGTVFELLLPALAVGAIVGIRHIPGVGDVYYTCPVSFNSEEPDSLGTSNVLFYTPDNALTKTIMNEAMKSWPEIETIIPLDDDLANNDTLLEELDTLYFQQFPSNSTYNYIQPIVVYFDKLEENGTAIEYTLRFEYDNGWHTNERADEFVNIDVRTWSPYMSYGFIWLQRALDETIIRYYAGKEGKTVPDITVSMTQFPFPDLAQNFFLKSLGYGLSILIILSYLYTAATITKELVIEKESRIRESMLMMGLRLWVLWTTWFIKQLLFMSIWVVAYTILFKYGRIWPRSDGFLILIFFLLFIMSIIAFGFLVSVWFNSPRIALIVSFLLFFVTYIPTLFIPHFYQTIPYVGKLALSLFSNTAFGLGVIVISDWEERQVGLQWNNLAEPLTIEEPLSVGTVFGMMIFDIVFYMLIAWYVDAVKPGRYGVPKPLYFPFLPSYWTGKPWKGSRKVIGSSGWRDPQAHEEEPEDLKAGIYIQNLTKSYEPGLLAKKRSAKLAVDELSLNMYEGQITALLGHNGAGKTTTISILTGLYTPTAGTAVINGYDIRSNMDQIRHSLGICPQHNVLFDRLTVMEHLRLFAVLKGMQFNQIKTEAESMLSDLQFEDKRNSLASKLSGGMKRKLSVGIALIGGSKTVVLDEPTSGMDPYARRATWDLLTKHKEGRTMLLTTHFMDEADLLGDRIAIMADGRLMCSGSSLFLKSKYGVGYHLTLVRGPACDSRGLSELITSTVPGSQLASDVSAELTFLLPFTSSQHFPTLLDTLEQQKQRYGFSSFGVSLTTLEEVFMKVGTGSTQIDDKVRGTGYQSLSQDEATEKLCAATKTEQAAAATGGATKGDIELQEIEQSGALVEEQKPATNYVRHTGIVLWIQQFMAMFLKRFYNSLRFYHAVITQLILPFIFIILALLIVKIPKGSSQGANPKRTLTLSGGSLSNEAETFWAHFGPLPPTFSFENVSVSDIHATKLEDITGAIQTIRNSVQNFTDINDCCGYEYQLLDKFCASRTVVDLEELSCGRDFVYQYCPECLSCSEYRYSSCLAPPPLSDDDIDSVLDPTGPLDNYDHYIAEYLLRRSGDILPSVFFRRVQAGFVFGYDEHTDMRPQCYSGIPSQNVTSHMNNFTATVWYNNQPYHVVPAALNAYHNVLLRNIMKNNDWSITVNNHPLPRTIETQEDDEYASALLGLAVSIVATFGFTFFLSSFVIFPVTERESKAKHLQFVSGVNPFSYWLANYAWDLVNAAIVVLITFIIFLAFQVDGYKGVTSLSAVFLILAFTCFASIPLAYCFSSIFKSHLVAYGVFFLFYFFPPMILHIVVLLLPSGDEDERRDRDIVHFFSLLHPGYGLQIGLLNIYITNILTDFCEQQTYEDTSTCFGSFAENIYQFTYPGIGANLMYMALEGVALLFVMVLIEYSFLVPLVRRLIYNYQNRNDVAPHAPVSQVLDSDVHAEALTVMEGQTDTNDAVIIKSMSKVYRPHLSGCSVAPSKRAVNRICLAIPRGEFFGFVGVNGAGKTTTFSILTGDLSPSEGTAVIGGYDIRTDIRHVRQRIGYCPQFDALIERMTGRELLTMFARLRGIPERHISRVVSSTITKLDLSKYANKQCGKYSGGNKRKLSTAIALIGDPPILFLDEPTTGMDPATRRCVWDVLTAVTREGRSIVLTTHSMEECEALCTRLTIMVNGEFKCLGSTQHLKSKFSDGYTLQVKVKTTAYTESPAAGEAVPSPPPPYTAEPGMPPQDIDIINRLKGYIQQSFYGSVLLEEHQGSLTYHLPSAGLTWSSIFRHLETNKERLGIVDYSVSQTTLDQVFINFAKQQEGATL